MTKFNHRRSTQNEDYIFPIVRRMCHCSSSCVGDWVHNHLSFKHQKLMNLVFTYEPELQRDRMATATWNFWLVGSQRCSREQDNVTQSTRRKTSIKKKRRIYSPPAREKLEAKCEQVIALCTTFLSRSLKFNCIFTKARSTLRAFDSSCGFRWESQVKVDAGFPSGHLKKSPAQIFLEQVLITS